MISKYCIHCGAKNTFEVTPKFCNGCGEPFNRSSASVKKRQIIEDDDYEDDEDEVVRFDMDKLKKDWSIEGSAKENWDKFGSQVGVAAKDGYNRKENIRPDSEADKKALDALKDACRFKGESKSIGD